MLASGPGVVVGQVAKHHRGLGSSLWPRILEASLLEVPVDRLCASHRGRKVTDKSSTSNRKRIVMYWAYCLSYEYVLYVRSNLGNPKQTQKLMYSIYILSCR